MIYSSKADGASSFSANYQPQWLIIIPCGSVSPSGRLSSRIIMHDIRPFWINIFLLSQKSCAGDEYNPHQMNIR
jgi:hypothetical protein